MSNGAEPEGSPPKASPRAFAESLAHALESSDGPDGSTLADHDGMSFTFTDHDLGEGLDLDPDWITEFLEGNSGFRVKAVQFVYDGAGEEADPEVRTDGGTPDPWPIQADITVDGDTTRYTVRDSPGETTVSEWLTEHPSGNLLDQAKNDIRANVGDPATATVTFHESGRHELESAEADPELATDGGRPEGEEQDVIAAELVADELMNLARHLYAEARDYHDHVRDAERGDGSEMAAALYQIRGDALMDAARYTRLTAEWFRGERERPPFLLHGEQLADDELDPTDGGDR